MRDGKHVILCVDDDPDVLEAMRIVLEANNYLMETAGSAEEGLQRYQVSNPDLVIIDLMMEEVDAGTRLVTELKAIGNKAPVFMLSSVGDQLNIMIDAAQLGLAGTFQKPIDPGVLLRTLGAKLKR